MKTPANKDETLRHLQTLYGDVEGFFSVCYEDDTGKFKYEFFKTSKLEAAADRIVELAVKTCVWFSTNPFKTKPRNGRGKVEDVSAIVALTAEIDFQSPHRKKNSKYPPKTHQAAVLKILKEIPGMSEIVSSGDGFHCYGYLADPFEIDDDTDRSRAIACAKGWQRYIHRALEDYGSFDGCHNIDKILRPIGSVHRKGEPKPVKAVFTSDIKTDFDRFEMILDAAGLLIDAQAEPVELGELPADDEVTKKIDAILANDETFRDHWNLDAGPKTDKGKPDRSAIAWYITCYLVEKRFDAETCFSILSRFQKETGKKEDLKKLIANAMEKKKSYGNESYRNQPKAGKGPEIRTGDELGIVRTFLSDQYPSNGLVSHIEIMYRFNGARYEEIPAEQMKRDLHRWLEKTLTVTGSGEKIERFPTQVKSVLIGNVYTLLRREVSLPGKAEATFWIPGTAGALSGRIAGDLLPLKDGLLDIRTRELLPLTPDLFVTSGPDFAYGDGDLTPVKWHKFLDDCFGDDAEAKNSLQEVFGYLVSSETKYDKAFMLFGDKRSGKGTTERVLTGLVGRDAITNPQLSDLHDKFTLQSMIGKRIAISADAQLSGRQSDHAQMIERFLTISGGGSVNIPRKFLPDYSGRLPCRFVILTNELPVPSAGAVAFADRFIIFKYQKTFYDQENFDLSDGLLAELPGILRWSLDGLDRVRRNNRLSEPKSSIELRNTLRRLTDEGLSFLEDCCIRGEGEAAPKALLFSLFKYWRSEVRGEDEDRKNAFKIATLTKLISRHGVSYEDKKVGPRGDQVRAYRGVSIDLTKRVVLDFIESIETMGIEPIARRGLTLILNDSNHNPN